MRNRRKQRRRNLAGTPRFTFEELPVGSCFAFDASAKKPTRRKVGDRQTIMLPDGQRKMSVVNVATKVSVLPCSTGFGRNKRRH